MGYLFEELEEPSKHHTIQHHRYQPILPRIQGRG